MKSRLFIFLAVVIALAVYSSAFYVQQHEQALVLEFQKAQRVIRDPGLHFKIPFIQEVNRYDKRILNHDLDSREIIAADQKRVIVDAFAKFQITNPLLFKQTVETESRMRERLNTNLDAKLREVIGTVPLSALLSAKRDNIMTRIREHVNKKVQDFGIEVVDVRIRRADLPKENSQAIYRRMQTEREQEAREFRATGEQDKLEIMSDADRQAKVIIAEAERDAEQLRGEGDATATKIFAESFGKDTDFFAFYRSMQAYQKSLNGSDTSLVISPDSEFMKYFSKMRAQ